MVTFIMTRAMSEMYWPDLSGLGAAVTASACPFTLSRW